MATGTTSSLGKLLSDSRKRRPWDISAKPGDGCGRQPVLASSGPKAEWMFTVYVPVMLYILTLEAVIDILGDLQNGEWSARY